jgi:hypothetical protein
MVTHHVKARNETSVGLKTDPSPSIIWQREP